MRQSLGKALAPVAALLFSVGLLLMGSGLQGTLLPVRAQLEAFTDLDLGMLGSAYFLGFGAGCLFGARLVRRSGHIRTFAAMVALASTTALAHAMLPSPPVWWVLRGVTGFCFAVLYMVIESWLNERASNENRGLIFSAYTIVNLTVITLGQIMLTAAPVGSFTLFAWASILVSLAAIPIAFTRAEAPAPIGAVKIRVRRLYLLSPVGFVGCFAVGMANSAFWSLGPLFVDRGQGVNAADVALFMSVTVIGGAVGQYPLGRLSDRMDRRRVIVLSCSGAALAGGALVATGELLPWAMLGAAFLFGFFAFPLYSLSVAHTNDFIEPEGYVEASGGLLLVFGLGAVVGPLIASAVARTFGIETIFAYTAVVHLLTAFFTLYRMTRRARPPEEERGAFVDALVVASTVSTVDPLRPHEAGERAPHPAGSAGEEPQEPRH